MITRTITGLALLPDGTPAAGLPVAIWPNLPGGGTPMPDPAVLLPWPVHTETDELGAFDVELATNDQGLVQGWTYTIEWHTGGATAHRALFALPAGDGTPVALADVLAVETSTGALVAKGDPGGDGEDGMSAYQLAVEAGFEGTLSEWLASLDGQDGTNGEPCSLTIGDVTTLAPAEPATATITGTAPNQTLNLGLPQGQAGAPGEPADNPIFTATALTGAPGSSAAVQLTGNYPNLNLGLTIPRGDPGNPTTYELRGTGTPEGVVAASPGTYYTDTAGTNGAWRWLKTSGTGSWGWIVVFGDTGWRKIIAAGVPQTGYTPTYSGVALPTGGNLRIRRVGATLWVSADALTWPSGASGTFDLLSSLPSAWLVSADNSVYPGAFYDLMNVGSPARVDMAVLRMSLSNALHNIRDVRQFPASGWPATLPGIPA